MDLLTVITVVGILTILFILVSKWRYQYWARQGIPQLEPTLFFGNFKPIVTGSVSIQDYFTNIYKECLPKGWNQVGIYKLCAPELVFLDLNLIKRIMIKDFEHFGGRGFYHDKSDPLSENLLNIEGEEWKKLRAKLTPTFTTGKMKMMFETLLEKTNVLNKLLNESAISDKEIQIKETLARFGTDVIGSVAFGIECNSMEEPDNKLRKIGKKAFEPSVLKFIIEDVIPHIIPVKFGYKSFDKEVSSYFTEVLTATIKYRESNNVQRKDFMQILLQLKNQGDKDGNTITVEEIVRESLLFYLAGFETSSSATTFALLELSQNQHVQDKLRQEILEVLGKHNDQLTYDVIAEMEYLDKVFHETLRKYPPAPVLTRICTKTYKIPGTGAVIEKGTIVYLPAWGIQKNPEYYPNPEEFNPENFSPESKANRPDFTWLPFGEGPRMCIGLRFGTMQSKVAIITLLKDFKFSPHEKTKWPLEMDTGAFVLTAKGDLWLKIDKVNN